MLDTNATNHALKLHPAFMENLKKVPISSLCISSITHAEIHYGLAKKPEAVKLHKAVKEFLKYVDILPFDQSVSESYGKFKASVEKHGKSLSTFDMMIAAHAYFEQAALVTNDQAFGKICELNTTDWTK